MSMFAVVVLKFPLCLIYTLILSYVADPPRGFASCLEKVMKRQWGSRRDTTLILEVKQLNFCADSVCLNVYFNDACLGTPGYYVH